MNTDNGTMSTLIALINVQLQMLLIAPDISKNKPFGSLCHSGSS